MGKAGTPSIAMTPHESRLSSNFFRSYGQELYQHQDITYSGPRKYLIRPVAILAFLAFSYAFASLFLPTYFAAEMVGLAYVTGCILWAAAMAFHIFPVFHRHHNADAAVDETETPQTIH